MDRAPVTRRIVVRGRVQGVGFRAYVVRNANALGLSGWVRNRPGGEVELVAHGPAGRIASLVDAVRRGPKWARVDDLEDQPVTDQDGEMATGRFKARPTG